MQIKCTVQPDRTQSTQTKQSQDILMNSQEFEDESQIRQYIRDADNVDDGDAQTNQKGSIHWVIPYHPAMAKLRLQQYINQLASNWLGKDTKIIITWKNQYQNLSNILRKSIITDVQYAA